MDGLLLNIKCISFLCSLRQKVSSEGRNLENNSFKPMYHLKSWNSHFYNSYNANIEELWLKQFFNSVKSYFKQIQCLSAEEKKTHTKQFKLIYMLWKLKEALTVTLRSFYKLRIFLF